MPNITKEERQRREDEAKANNLNPNPLAGDTSNPREPNYPIREDREGPPMRGDAGVAVGRIGTIAPLSEQEKAEDAEKGAKPDPNAMPIHKMRLKHGVFLEENKKTSRGEVIDLPLDRARQLFEDGVAEFVVDLPV